MKESVIVGFQRSPFTNANKGELSKIRPEDILSQVINDLIIKTKVKTEDIEDIIIGCAYPEGAQGYNIAKIMTFMTNMPEHVAGMTVNRWCGSSMQAIHSAAGSIAINAGKVFVCGGVESMSFVPINGLNFTAHPKLFSENPYVYMSMGDTAENIAKKYYLDRKIQQEFSIESHQKAFMAEKNGKFKDEISIIKDNDKIISRDGCIRPNTSQDTLNNLKLAFDEQNGTITAGTSSPLTDGASSTLVCEEKYALENDLNILAKIKSTSVNGCSPEYMGLGPIEASRKALMRANLNINDIDLFEINEAFSSQCLACIKDLKIDKEKVNIDGGALALGHPLGATGVRITAKAAQLLNRENKKYALVTQCIGLGQGIATVLESIK